MDERPDAAGAVLLRWLARTVLLAFWALVGWGWLVLASTLVAATGEGLRPALARLLPPRGGSTWAWLNVFSAMLALAVGLVVGGVVLWTVRGSPPSASAWSSRRGDERRPLPPAS